MRKPTAKPAKENRPKARLVKSRDGFLVFRAPKGSPKLTRARIKHLEVATS